MHRVPTVLENLLKLWNFTITISRPGKVRELVKIVQLSVAVDATWLSHALMRDSVLFAIAYISTFPPWVHLSFPVCQRAEVMFEQS